jgi:hypothetical protein
MNSKTSSNWQIVAEDVWLLDSSVNSCRRAALIDGRGFDRIVADVLESLEIVDIRFKPLKNDKNKSLKRGERDKRAVVKLRSSPEAVDQFHNSSSGYRAQYYVSTELGANANRMVVEALSARILEFAERVDLPKVSPSLLSTSLHHPQSKVWIHQGPWLIFSHCEDRVLRVPRWQVGLNSLDKDVRKLARWASLAPWAEAGIDVKGGLLSPCGEPVLGKGKAASDRSASLHSIGFT